MARSSFPLSPLILSSIALLAAIVPEPTYAGIGSSIGGNIGSALADSGLSVGAIIGIIAGIVVFCVLIAFCRHACRQDPHAHITATSETTGPIVPILPTPQPQPQPGTYYPPMSPLPTPAPPSIAVDTYGAPSAYSDAARPVTADEYNQIYRNLGMATQQASGTTTTAAGFSPAPTTIYPSPAMTNSNTIASPPSTVTSPYMGSTTSGSISAVTSPYLTGGTGNIGGGASSSTQVSTLQPAPAISYPQLPPAAPTLTQAYLPPSSNSQTSYPLLNPVSTSHTTSLPSYFHGVTDSGLSGAPTMANTATMTSAAPEPLAVASRTSMRTSLPLTTEAMRVRTVQYAG